jgi:hypothetical protein
MHARITRYEGAAVDEAARYCVGDEALRLLGDVPHQAGTPLR